MPEASQRDTVKQCSKFYSMKLTVPLPFNVGGRECIDPKKVTEPKFKNFFSMESLLRSSDRDRIKLHVERGKRLTCHQVTILQE